MDRGTAEQSQNTYDQKLIENLIFFSRYFPVKKYTTSWALRNSKITHDSIDFYTGIISKMQEKKTTWRLMCQLIAGNFYQF